VFVYRAPLQYRYTFESLSKYLISINLFITFFESLTHEKNNSKELSNITKLKRNSNTVSNQCFKKLQNFKNARLLLYKNLGKQ